MSKKLIECVPNISEGRDLKKINEISSIVETIEGIKLLNVDPGKATNRTAQQLHSTCTAKQMLPF